MTEAAPRRVRPSAKAVVGDGNRILVTRNRTPGDDRGDWFILPGGGQMAGETLHQTVVREVREETGIEVRPGRLLWVRELNVVPHPDWPFDPRDQPLELMFAAEFVADHGDAHDSDQYQVAVEWVRAADLVDFRFYPSSVVPALTSYLSGGSSGAVYLGEAN